MFENNVVIINGFTTFPKILLLKPMVSSTLFLEMSKQSNLVAAVFSTCKTNGVSNIMFGIVVKPMVLAI